MEENENMEQSEQQVKNRKTRLMIIGLVAIVVALVGATYAFFNYTRIGGNNTIKVGRIYFNTRQNGTINLNNLFPIDPTETGIMNDSTKVGTIEIEIEGDTDYVDGVEYLVSSVNTNIYTSTGKSVPISIVVTPTNLGTSNDNYFTARESKNATIYKKLVGDTLVGDGMLLVGYIKPNTTSGTAEGIQNGSITIKAYLDKNKILISDTYPAEVVREVKTTGYSSSNCTAVLTGVSNASTYCASASSLQTAIDNGSLTGAQITLLINAGIVSEYTNGTPDSMAVGKTVFTTSEWNSLQSSGISFKIKVEANEGIWVNGSLEEIMKTKNYSTTLNRGIRDNESSPYVSSNSGINFGAAAGDTNGKGVYMRAGTQNDDYPILYYRGEIEDNNVAFNNKCWKAVRTTDTGGVKLIYNGELSANKAALSLTDYGTPLSNNGFTFDITDNSWNATMTTNIESSEPYEISFNVPAGDGYVLQITGVPTSVGAVGVGVYKGGSQVNFVNRSSGNPYEVNHTFGTLTSNSSDAIRVTFYMLGGNSTEQNPSTIKVRMLKPDVTSGMGCNNQGSASQITLKVTGIDTNTFYFTGPNDYDSPAYVGYMRGTNVYKFKQKNSSSTFKFGTGFTYSNGMYTLTSADDGVSSMRHYTCFTDSETCNGTDLGKIYYVYYNSGNSYYYIELENGKSVEDAFVEMKTNTVDSNAKDKIDKWYLANMTDVTNKLEDTIWCNDRSVEAGNNNGWIANGGNLTTHLYYGAHGRGNQSSNNATKNQPSLACVNKNDRFTVNNNEGNMALTYPIALLTADEMVLAGATETLTPNSLFYLTSGLDYWSMSPSYFFGTSTGAFEYYLEDDGIFRNQRVTGAYGLRPAISIKPGQLIKSGTGTVSDPYVIE